MIVQPLFDHICGWGEGLCWDSRTQKLYFVDCSRSMVGITDLDNPNEITFVKTPSMPTKVLLTTDSDRSLVLLDDGFYEIVDGVCGAQPVIGMPSASVGRFNDAGVDFAGNIVTGNLNLSPTEGSAFWIRRDGFDWQQFSPNKTNANGPCFSADGRSLYVADTPSGIIYHYEYDAITGSIGRCFSLSWRIARAFETLTSCTT